MPSSTHVAVLLATLHALVRRSSNSRGSDDGASGSRHFPHPGYPVRPAELHEVGSCDINYGAWDAWDYVSAWDPSANPAHTQNRLRLECLEHLTYC